MRAHRIVSQVPPSGAVLAISPVSSVLGSGVVLFSLACVYSPVLVYYHKCLYSGRPSCLPLCDLIVPALVVLTGLGSFFLRDLVSPRGALGGGCAVCGFRCLLKGQYIPTSSGVVGGGCPVFINQLIVLHDVKNHFFRMIQSKVLASVFLHAVGGLCPRVPSTTLCGSTWFLCSSAPVVAPR